MKYADGVGEGKGFTKFVRLRNGRDALIEVPFIIFKNEDRNQPIRGGGIDVPNVSYRLVS